MTGLAEHVDRRRSGSTAPCAFSGLQPAQRRREVRAAEAVDRRVDLVDLALVGRRVGVLDDAVDAAVLVADDPAVARAGRRRATVRIVAAASPSRCSVASIASVSAGRSGVSAGSTRMSSSASRSSANAVSATLSGVAGAALDALLDELDRTSIGRSRAAPAASS